MLSDGNCPRLGRNVFPSQCTFWCSVLSDGNRDTSDCPRQAVSMHLLVLSAFRRPKLYIRDCGVSRLNAPFGAQCFPTPFLTPLMAGLLLRLNAPFGAQCFPTRTRTSMRGSVGQGLNAPFGAQCFPTKQGSVELNLKHKSQCTFWCSVLSDYKQWHDFLVSPCLNAPFGAQCFPTCG